jgi:hypothetical protein
MRKVLEFTNVNFLHLLVGNYSRRMMVRDVIPEMGRVPQTVNTTLEQRSIDQAK